MSFPGSSMLGQTALNNLNSTFNVGNQMNNNNSSDLIQTQQAF